ncbi:MAG: hypothetical protein JW749_10850 [Sedimentisphaerales bacterium]|nr:hypothetical protein [Sedimentisphaerales bacterium]
MKKQRYRRKCGDFEIRVLADGRVALLAPDDELLAIAGELDPENTLLPPKTRDKKNART